MPINRAPFNALIDDTGTGTTGTIWNKAQIQSVLLDPIDALVGGGGSVEWVASGAAALIPLTPGYMLHLVGLNSAVNVTLNGTTGGGRVNGERLILLTYGAGGINSLAHNVATPEKFINQIASPTPLNTGGGVAEYLWNPLWGAWKLINYEQGGAIAVPFNAANFTMSGGTGAFTVTAAQVLRQDYYLRGNQLTLGVVVAGGSTTAGTGTGLQIAGWPFSFAGNQFPYGISNLAVGGWGMMMGSVIGANALSFSRLDFGAIPTGAAYLYATGQALSVV